MTSRLLQGAFLFSAVLVSGATPAGDRIDSNSELSIVLVSRSVSSGCRAERDVKRELFVCRDAKGCDKHDLNRNQGVSFALPRSGSFTLAAQGEYEDVRDAFRDVSEVPERIVQVVEATNQCELTFVYRVVR